MVTEEVPSGRPGPATHRCQGALATLPFPQDIRPIIHTKTGNATRSSPKGPAVTASPSVFITEHSARNEQCPKTCGQTLLQTRGRSDTLAAGPLDLDRKQFHAIAGK